MSTVNRVHAVHSEAHTFDLELTDTFGGEANYSWVKRAEISFDKNYTDRQFMRQAKAALGLSGVRCRVESYGDSYTLRPYGLLQIAFITFRY